MREGEGEGRGEGERRERETGRGGKAYVLFAAAPPTSSLDYIR